MKRQDTGAGDYELRCREEKIMVAGTVSEID